jgi:hypothetical protein
VNAALIASEQLANELDAGVAPARSGGAAERPLDTNPPELFEAACTALGLEGSRLEAVRVEAAEIVRALFVPAPPSSVAAG